MARPRIGVACDLNPGDMERFGGDEAHHFVNARYTRAVEAAGGEPWLLPVPTQGDAAGGYLDRLDGLVLTGCGRHIDPAAYGEAPRFDLELLPPPKLAFELALVRGALARDLPMLAICGGMQSLNVALGGTLIQRIGDEVAGAVEHKQADTATRCVHAVDVTPGSLLHRVTGRERLEVNSSHTQAVARAGDKLAVSGTAPDGVVEALEHAAARWALGVQWHPEYLYGADPAQAALFAALVAAAGGAGG